MGEIGHNSPRFLEEEQRTKQWHLGKDRVVLGYKWGFPNVGGSDRKPLSCKDSLKIIITRTQILP
jgi:hypothetical protein